jgi:hypothetical protein
VLTITLGPMLMALIFIMPGVIDPDFSELIQMFGLTQILILRGLNNNQKQGL